MLTKQLRRLVPERWIAAEYDRLLSAFAGHAQPAGIAGGWIGGEVERWWELLHRRLQLDSSQPTGCLTDHAYEFALGLLHRAHDYLESIGHPPSRRRWLDLYATRPVATRTAALALD